MTQHIVSFYLTGLQHLKKNRKAIPRPMFNHHSPIPWGSFRGRQEEKWGSFRGRFGDHFRVGDHFGVGIISGAVQHASLGLIVIQFPPSLLLYVRAHLYGLGYPRQPSPRVTLAEVSFSLFLCKINEPFTSGSRTRLGGRDNSGERVSPRQVG